MSTMNFEYEITENDSELDVKLVGYLDAANAAGFHESMKKYEGKKYGKIVFDAENLEYIASAGIRVIIFAKQKIGYDSEIIFKKPNETVKSVFEMSGLDNFLTIEE